MAGQTAKRKARPLASRLLLVRIGSWVRILTSYQPAGTKKTSLSYNSQIHKIQIGRLKNCKTNLFALLYFSRYIFCILCALLYSKLYSEKLWILYSFLSRKNEFPFSDKEFHPMLPIKSRLDCFSPGAQINFTKYSTVFVMDMMHDCTKNEKRQ